MNDLFGELRRIIWYQPGLETYKGYLETAEVVCFRAQQMVGLSPKPGRYTFEHQKIPLIFRFLLGTCKHSAPSTSVPATKSAPCPKDCACLFLSTSCKILDIYSKSMSVWRNRNSLAKIDSLKWMQLWVGWLVGWMVGWIIGWFVGVRLSVGSLSSQPANKCFVFWLLVG